jgi:hypothetical protein
MDQGLYTFIHTLILLHVLLLLLLLLLSLARLLKWLSGLTWPTLSPAWGAPLRALCLTWSSTASA